MFELLQKIFGGGTKKLPPAVEARLKLAQSCPQNVLLPRVPGAGSVEKGHVLTHNGLRLSKESLGNNSDWQLLQANGGVLEPQQEFAFAEVARTLPNMPTMLDVGARSGFYSMWLKMMRPGARCVMVEPNLQFLKNGQKNFETNKLKSQSLGAYIGRKGGRTVEGVPVMTLLEVVNKVKTDYLSILLADIQGYELELVTGAEPLLKERAIDNIIISTHANALHNECRNFLQEYRYNVLVDIPPTRAYSPDGLLVVRRKELKGLETLGLEARSEAPKA